MKTLLNIFKKNWGQCLIVILYGVLLAWYVIRASVCPEPTPCNNALIVIEYGDTLAEYGNNTNQIPLSVPTYLSNGDKLSISVEEQIVHGAKEWAKLTEEEKN